MPLTEIDGDRLRRSGILERHRIVAMRYLMSKDGSSRNPNNSFTSTYQLSSYDTTRHAIPHQASDENTAKD